MLTRTGWRRFLTCATIDAFLITAAGAAWAASAAAKLPETGPAMPALLLVGVGLVTTGLHRRGG